jgi:hypothetical protein
MEFERLLKMARSLVEGSPVLDEFQRLAAVGYRLRGLLDRLALPDWMLTTTWRWAIAFLGSRDDRRELLAVTTARHHALSRYRVVSLIEQHTPRLGHAWRVFCRWLRLPAVILLAAVLTGLARFHVRRSGL